MLPPAGNRIVHGKADHSILTLFTSALGRVTETLPAPRAGTYWPEAILLSVTAPTLSNVSTKYVPPEPLTWDGLRIPDTSTASDCVRSPGSQF